MAATAAVALAVALGGCGGSHHNRGAAPPRPQPAAPSVAPTTALSFALDTAAPANWNVHTAGSYSEALTPIADQVWPSVFTFGPSFTATLNTELVQSATQVSASPQTIVYRINPKAAWSDGTPITGGDFVYNWQVLSAKGAGSEGYNLVRSVTVSPASPDVVTVVMSSPDPDWPALFRHMVPAHVGQKVGFDAGFTDPVADLVSGGPYMVVAFDPSGLLRLVRNPSWWGAPAASLELNFRYLPEPGTVVAALAAGQISCADLPATPAALVPLKNAKGVNVKVSPGADYVDLEFNQVAGPMQSVGWRQAVTAAVSRPSVATAAVGNVEADPPLVGNRFLVPGEDGYAAHGPPSQPPPSASRPSPAVPLRLAVDAASPVLASAATVVASQLQSAGYPVSVVAPGAQWDLTLTVRTLTPFPGAAAARYLTGSATNTSGVSVAALDSAIDAAAAAPSLQRGTLMDRADQAAWAAHVDLPIVALPEVVACQSNIAGAGPNAAPDGPAYNAASWGLTGGAS